MFFKFWYIIFTLSINQLNYKNMGQFITLTELVLIFIICFPVYALGKTIIETIENKTK